MDRFYSKILKGLLTWFICSGPLERLNQSQEFVLLASRGFNHVSLLQLHFQNISRDLILIEYFQLGNLIFYYKFIIKPIFCQDASAQWDWGFKSRQALALYSGTAMMWPSLTCRASNATNLQKSDWFAPSGQKYHKSYTWHTHSHANVHENIIWTLMW